MFGGILQSFGLRTKSHVLLAPLAGMVIPLSEVHDTTFSSGMLGHGVAIKPTGNKVVSPSDAKVEAVFPTGHALALHTDEGMDILIHIGLDTVKLEGKYFTVRIEVGQTVKRGDVLIEFDREAIEREGYDVTAPILICNAVEYSSIKGDVGKQVAELDELIVARER